MNTQKLVKFTSATRGWRVVPMAIVAFCMAATVSSYADANIAEDVKRAKAEYDIAALVYPGYHPEPRWKELGLFPEGQGEWFNVKDAKPKSALREKPNSSENSRPNGTEKGKPIKSGSSTDRVIGRKENIMMLFTL